MKTIEVVAAIVVHDGKVLCVQRGESKLDYISKKFEFPGGKLEANETLEQALTREMAEELKMFVTVERLFLTVEHSYPDFNLVMHSFICQTNSRQLTLTEHLQALWLGIDELDILDWAAADIPIVEQLKECAL
ncbi:(deoxy)nucleoside triphosphate pyrophosphohydrolase [Psychrobacter arenosus]|uniref:(deoxy)nucleoside triphosphate pyrophosphohydrolase n=1 Tax=Psychrobacter arenosus TaxID=256326 RepID=UPI00191AEF1C|nr:(deoxy)nucleoside triphosphate pyrophosphohydrolase [Psychrobacter arenosus]